MTRPRSTLVSVADTPYYHCIGRCVRRAFLCGQDPHTGRNFDHRKALIAERLALLTNTFAIDLCAYALMSNHYHLVVRLNPTKADDWSPQEVAARWARLFGSTLAKRFAEGAAMNDLEQAFLTTRLPVWQVRLTDLSWFMRCLNEYIARVANLEDGCTGRFWEGRFKSQALLDEAALITAMAYVDLNPIRAGLATSVQDCSFTSGQQRLGELTQVPDFRSASPTPRLLPFAQALAGDNQPGLPFALQAYLELLGTTGRLVHPGKRGLIPDTTPGLLFELGLEAEEWLRCMTDLHVHFRYFLGAPHRMQTLAEKRGWRWLRGQAAARRLYRRANE